MRVLVIEPNRILHQKCEVIEEITPFIRKLAGDLMEFLDHTHGGVVSVGVSAPQLGESVRMFAFRLNPYSILPSTRVLINPILVYGKKLRTVSEMCISIPGREFALQRYALVKVRGVTLEGGEVSFKVHGIVAQAIQHELSHLDGVLIGELGKEVYSG